MRPTDKFGTFNSTSGGVEVETDAAEETVVAIVEEDMRVALVDGMIGEDEREDEVVAESPCDTKVKNPKQATSLRRLK
jgi:hypothetical protein